MTGLSWPRLGIVATLASHILLVSSGSVAQEPRIAGLGPAVTVSVGYAYLNSEIPSAGRISENGVATSVATEFTRRFGIKAEISYTRTYGAFGIPHHSDVLAYLAGPVIYPVRRKRFAIYGEGLVGAARIVGVVPQKNGLYLFAYVQNPAWALGAGVETPLSRSIALRTGVDYFRASYFTPANLIRGQGNTRALISLVYTFGKAR